MFIIHSCILPCLFIVIATRLLFVAEFLLSIFVLLNHYFLVIVGLWWGIGALVTVLGCNKPPPILNTTELQF
jgi:hypothetical protein